MRVLAEDAEDLELVSAAVQDALLVPRMLEVDARGRVLTARLVRFRWENAVKRRAKERVEAALQIHSVTGVRARGFDRQDETPRPILSLGFAPEDTPPGGTVRIVFAGGGQVEVSVECLDVTLGDVSHPWPTRSQPDHDKGADS